MDEQTVDPAGELAAVGLDLPAEHDDSLDESALRLERMLDSRSLGGELDPEAQAAFTSHYETLRDHVEHYNLLHPVLDIWWPDSWYIPSEADYKAHWFLPPPDDRRYGHDWMNSSTNRASRATGHLYAFAPLRPRDRIVTSDAAIGVTYSPPFAYGEISVRPTVACTGQSRWWEMLDQPMSGSGHTRANILVAMWQRIPNGWDLVGWDSYLVHDGYEQSPGSGSAIMSTTRSFKGDQLATNFIAQKGRTYLIAVIARVIIRSTLAAEGLAQLPEFPDPEKFKIWGGLVCDVPRIEVKPGPVYIW